MYPALRTEMDEQMERIENDPEYGHIQSVHDIMVVPGDDLENYVHKMFCVDKLQKLLRACGKQTPYILFFRAVSKTMVKTLEKLHSEVKEGGGCERRRARMVRAIAETDCVLPDRGTAGRVFKISGCS